MTGTTISNYKILEKLGEGGMGVVYKAEDTRLKRVVALKFLPSHLSASEQDKARFVQEAQAASALNHPNVCTIYDIQEHDGKMFIVMEFVDGVTLREKTKSAPVNQKASIEIAIQVADGLAAAHEKGIVHRDIKPENIMIRKDGIAQIMDFGLAKLRESGSKITRLTVQGSTVGTAGYMSPEQVQGQDADHRSDIFSFGVLFYELLAGQLPFKGAHETALAYEIVNVDPVPVSAIKPDIGEDLDVIVLDCLEKDPRERCQSIAEVARDLRRIKRESTRQRVSRITAARPVYAGSAVRSGLKEPAEHAPGLNSRLPWIAAALFFLIAAAAIAYHFLSLPAPVEKRVMRSLILPPASNIFDVTWGGHISISPDGKAIAYVATDTIGINHVWVRHLSALTATQLPGTDEAKYPFWSYDSRKIGFFARGKLKNVDLVGGPVLTICDAGDGRGGSWNQYGVIIFPAGPTEPLFRVSAAGGIPTRITQFDTTHRESSHRWPVFLPDGNHFIYSTLTAIGAATDNDIVRVSALDSSINKVLITASSNVNVASGYLLYVRQGTLMAQPFDTEKIEFQGDAVPIAEQIIFNSPYSRGSFATSQNGLLILQSGENQIQHAAIFDGGGNRVRLLPDLNPAEPVFSNDGKFIAFFTIDPLTRNGDIWLNELSRGVSSRLTTSPAIDIRPVWSPRGDSIAFQSNRNGPYDLYIRSTNGAGEEAPLVQSNRNKIVTAWSLDGRYITFMSTGDPKTKNDVWIMPTSGDRKPIPLMQTEFNEGNGAFSPDSRWVVYNSDETGRSEIYARLLDGSGGKVQISRNGGRKPIWKSDTKKLYFSSMDRKLQVAYVNPGATTLVVDSIQTLWDYESRGIVGNTINDVSSDGKYFIGVITESKQTSAPITIVWNWDEELKKNK